MSFAFSEKLILGWMDINLVYVEMDFMSLITKNEEQLLDPLSEKISERLSACSGGVVIDRFRLKEFVFARAKRIILQKHPDWIEEKMDEQTLARLIDFNVRLDYNEDLAKLVEEFISLCKEEDKDPEFFVRVEKHEETKRQVFFKELPEDHKEKEIDVPVASGRRTRLHLACENGDFNEVQRLVEKCGAKIKIKDASKWTPKDRAKLNNKTENHAKIIEYLDNFD